MNLLRSRRAVALAWILPGFFVRLAGMRLRGPLTPQRRAEWLHRCCRDVLAALGIRLGVVGEPPRGGLVVSNHLSYLDIAVYAAAMPCAFVSKAEVSAWPYFGAAARAAGTVFLNRASHSSALAAGDQMRARLAAGIPVLLFPEGTSTDGSQMRRFHSTLFEPAIALGEPVTVAAIRYQIADGSPEREVCWYGDEGFLPHLARLLAIPGISAEVVFSEMAIYPDRRTAAALAQRQVEMLRGADAHSVSLDSIAVAKI